MPKQSATSPSSLTFDGFGAPNYTQVPDVLFDQLLPHLTDAELRVLLYVVRRTFGFKRDSDNISLKQMVDGIRTTDGRVLDQGAGISKSAAAKAVKGLVEKGIIVTQRNRSAERGDEPTTYLLRFQQAPLSTRKTPPCPPNGHARVHVEDTQETGVQETDGSLSKFERSHDQEDFHGADSTEPGSVPETLETAPDASESAQGLDRPPPAVSRPTSPQNAPDRPMPERSGSQEFMTARDAIRSTLAARMSLGGDGGRRSRRNDASASTPQPESGPSAAARGGGDVPALPRRRGRPITGTSDERDLVYAYLNDFNVELLHDDAPLASLVTQTINIFREGDVPLERWPDFLYQARAAVREHAGSITKASRRNGTFKNRGPYYFAVLRNLVNPEPARQPQPPEQTP